MSYYNISENCLNYPITVDIQGKNTLLGIVHDFPAVSTKTNEVVQQLPDFPTENLPNLRCKAEDLARKIMDLPNSKEPERRDKILAVLRVALTAALLAGCIIGIVMLRKIHHEGWAFLVGVTAFLAYAFLSYYNFDQLNKEEGSIYNPCTGMGILLLGPFLPFAELSKMCQVDSLKKEMGNDFANFMGFMETKYDSLKKALEKKIHELELSNSDYEIQLNKYKDAKSQLEKAYLYFQAMKA